MVKYHRCRWELWEIRKEENTWVIFDHRVVLSNEDKKQIAFVKSYFEVSGMHTPLLSKLIPASQKKKIPEKKLRQILNLLISTNTIFNIDSNFIWADTVNKCRIALLNYVIKHKEGITVANFRDLVKGNRKICLLLLSQYDSEGIVVRNGDYRQITNKGKAVHQDCNRSEMFNK